MKKEFQEVLNKGIIHVSDRPHTSALHLIPKPGSMDFRVYINSSTVPDRYAVLYIQDFASGQQGPCIFSKINLIKAYHQITVAMDDIPKTAVTTPFGLYKFVKMPSSLRNDA